MSELATDVTGAGPPVLLLHGQPGSRRDWALVVEHLEADFTVIVPDRPGYGETGGRARGFRGNAAAVISLLDQLRSDRVIVVGHSWGGGVALALVEAAPERLAGLVLVSSISPVEKVKLGDRLMAVPPIGAAVTAVGSGLAQRVISLPPVRRRLLRGQLYQQASAAALDAFMASWRDARVRESFITEQRCLIDELPSLAAVLPAVAVPTTVLIGTADRTVPPDTGRRLAQAISGARLVELPGATHVIAHQRPEAVVAAVYQVAGR